MLFSSNTDPLGEQLHTPVKPLLPITKDSPGSISLAWVYRRSTIWLSSIQVISQSDLSVRTGLPPSNKLLNHHKVDPLQSGHQTDRGHHFKESNDCFFKCSVTKNRHLNRYCYSSVISLLWLTSPNSVLSLFAFLVTLYGIIFQFSKLLLNKMIQAFVLLMFALHNPRNSFTKYHHLNFGLWLFVIRRALSLMGVYFLIYEELCRWTGKGFCPRIGSVYITGSIMAAGKIGTKIDNTGKTFLFRTDSV